MSCGFLLAVLRDFMFFLSFSKPHCAAVRKLEFWMSNTTMTVLHSKPPPRVTSCYSVLLSAPDPSLVPRSHPLTRRNSLVNQLEFLGLAGTFATV